MTPQILTEFPISSLFGTNPLLSEFGTGDYKFSLWRSDAEKAAKLLSLAANHFDNDTLARWSDRISRCSQSLFYRNSAQGIKLYSADFCKVRVCPVCCRRKSSLWIAKTKEIFPQIFTENRRFLMLTLTIKNCLIEDLRNHLKYFSKAFNNFLTSVRYHLSECFLGYIRSFECTLAKKGKEAHPHYHLILAVDDEYFNDWLSHGEWQSLWQKALDVDYKPQIRINAINPDYKMGGLLEVLKYELKPDDFVSYWKWLGQYSLAINRFRRISTGGIFKNQLRFLEYDPDMIHEADYQELKSLGGRSKKYVFRWDSQFKQYILR